MSVVPCWKNPQNLKGQS